MERDFEASSETISTYAGKKEFFVSADVIFFPAGFAVVFRPDGDDDIVSCAFGHIHSLRVCGMA
jgi:hypothetical protein